MPPFPARAARAAPKSSSSDQFTTSDFWHNPEPSAASSGGFDGSCHDFPATKRRKLNENHSLTPYEAYPTQQEQLSWPQQTPFPPQYSHLSHQSQGCLTPQDWGCNLQPQIYLSGDQHQDCRQPQDWKASQQHQAPLSKQCWESNDQYHPENPQHTWNATDARGWDLAGLHKGFQASCHPTNEQPSQITSYQTTLPQDRPVPQKSLQTSNQTEDSWCLEVSVLEYEVQSQVQSTGKHHCGPNKMIKSPEPPISGQRFDLQQECPKRVIQNSDAEESGRPVVADATEVCYGMLVDIVPKSTVSPPNAPDWSQSLVWDGAMALHDSESGLGCAQLQERTFNMLTTLSNHAEVNFQFLAQGNSQDQGQTSIASKKNVPLGLDQRDPRFSITLYGPLDMAGPVGSWLDKCHLYLQMPEKCDRNVPYCNPHCLSFSDKDKNMTFELVARNLGSDMAEQYESADLLAELDNDEHLEEAPQPSLIASSLHKHQKQGLTFMINREKGWDLSGSRRDVWQSYLDSRGTIRYRNALSGKSQLEPPPEFKGGCLADCMGLGKTLTMLSLIAANPFPAEDPETTRGVFVQEFIRRVKATLIIVPFSLLQVWETQIQRHFRPSSVKVLVFYGQGRHKHCRFFINYDIILTTYNSVSLDWKLHKLQRQGNDARSLFSTYWHRVVLDEAHMIRSNNTANAKSIFAIEAEHRWCITGTPIQNRLGDLCSLLRFLRVHPYDDPRVFEAEISQPWKNKMDKTGLEKLQSLVKMIALRRSRMVISLPDRHEILHHVQFTTEESIVYNRARMGTIEVIESALSENLTGSAYISAFQRINDLRYICNHGVLPTRAKRWRNNHNEATIQEPCSFQEELDKLLNGSNPACVDCGTDIDEVGEHLHKPLAVSPLGENLQLCQDCLDRRKTCSYPSPKSSETSDMDDMNAVSPGGLCLSSKIGALISRLQQVPPEDKCVIFSYWTSTLDLIEHGLRQVAITFCRYDGRLSRAKRYSVLDLFANDASVQVILVSITCGGQGLDLTAANHAFLVEPQWNPMLEEQAMSRVHRLGQTKAVNMVRFIVKNTWEEKIVTVQERKRNLADMIMDGRRLKGGDDGRKQLLHLRELVG